MKRFDRKFGVDFLAGLPQTPGVYLFKDEAGEVLYVGKAKNLRRRLAQYRNANRRKAQRKMRQVVRESSSVEIRLEETEAKALLAENELIRALRPRFNVDGAFDFLYPAIGTGRDADRLVLCLTSEPEQCASLGLEWHGVFRPRWRARSAFDALTDLFSRVGHAEPRSSLPAAPRRRGVRLVAFRRVPDPFLADTRRFLNGEDEALLGRLFDALLERPSARDEAGQVEEALRFLADFYRSDVSRLHTARQQTGHAEPFVPRGDRDALFLRARLDLAPDEIDEEDDREFDERD